MAKDDKALRNARKNLVGGAILLPLCVIIQIYGLIAQGRISGLWLVLTAVSTYYVWHSRQLLKAAKARTSQPPTAHAGSVDNRFSWPQN